MSWWNRSEHEKRKPSRTKRARRRAAQNTESLEPRVVLGSLMPTETGTVVGSLLPVEAVDLLAANQRQDISGGNWPCWKPSISRN